MVAPGETLTVTTWSGNQPPRREVNHAVVVEDLGEGGAWIRYTDGPFARRETRVSAAWLARHARRPLDPTPPGPPLAAGEQTALDLEEIR